MARKQVVIVGAGMSGMISAALLAKEADMDVLVLEKEQVIGGRTMSFGGHHGAFSEKEYRQILRGASSVHVVASQPSVQEIIDDHDLFNTWIIDAGWHGVSSGDRSRYSTLAKALGSRLPCAPQVGLCYHEDGQWKEMRDVFAAWSIQDKTERNRIALLKLAISNEESHALDHVHLSDWLRSVTDNVKVQDYFGLLSRFQAGINRAEDVSAGEWIRVNNITSSTGAHLTTGGGMGDVAGGFRNITLVFSKIAEAAGAEVRTNAKVKEVLFDGNHVKGVEVEYGRHGRTSETIECDHLISTLPIYDVYNIIGEDKFPDDWNERIKRIQPLPGILGNVVVKELLETDLPKGMFVAAELPGPTVKDGVLPAYGFEQTSVIDPDRKLKGDSHLLQTWVGLWHRDPDEYHDAELHQKLVNAQLDFMRAQYPQFDDVLEWYIFVVAERVYGLNAQPRLVGDRKIPVQHPLIGNLVFSGDTVDSTDYGTACAAHSAIKAANAVSGQDFLKLLPEMMR